MFEKSANTKFKISRILQETKTSSKPDSYHQMKGPLNMVQELNIKLSNQAWEKYFTKCRTYQIKKIKWFSMSL